MKPVGESRLCWIVVAACAIILLLTALQPVAGMFVRISNDYGEGWSAYWARAAVDGTSLYPVASPLVANNYPPLFFYVDGYLGRIVGDNIFAGRIISLASLLTISVLIGAILSLIGSARRWSLVGSLVFLVFAAASFREFFAVSNPQWFGQAVALLSLLFLIRAEPNELPTGSVVIAAALMVVAGLIKHNQIALPLAVTIWLYLYNRRALAWWCLSGVIFAGLAVATLWRFYGDAVFVEILGFKRTTDFRNFLNGFVTTAGLGGLLVVAAASFRRLRSRPRPMLLLLYAGLGTLSGLTQRLGAGVFLNAHFDALIGLVLVLGAFLGLSTTDAVENAPDARARGRWLMLALAPVLVMAPLTTAKSLGRFLDVPNQERAWAGIITGVRATHGPVLCEMLAVCYWAGKPMGIDFFAYGQRLRTGTDPAPLEDAIKHKKIAVLVVDRNKHYFRGDGRLPQPLPQLIEKNYKIALSAKRYLALVVPRT